MGKIAFLFPGQGAQYVGMGKDVFENNKKAQEIFEIANESLGFDITKLCFEGPEEELVKTENTQPAILTTSVAILKAIEELGIEADVTAGLSLGEYGALVYSKALKFDKAIQVVKKRGKYMQEAVPLGQGTMAAIIGLEDTEVENLLEEAKVYGIVEGANYNCPQQVVIAGEVAAVEKVCELAKEKGAKRAVLLSVSAPFHSSMLKPAGDKLEKELEKIVIAKPEKKVISNVTADYVNSTQDISTLLTKQVYSPVLWQNSIELMLKDGVDTFFEVGPGKTLTAFVKKIAKKSKVKVNCYNVENMKDVEALKENLIKR